MLNLARLADLRNQLVVLAAEIDEEVDRLIQDNVPDPDPQPDPEPDPDPDPEPEPDPQPTPSSGIWTSAEELARRPDSGPLWDNVKDAAGRGGSPDVSDQNEKVNVYTLAKALVFARTGDEQYRDQVVSICGDVIGTDGGRTLALGRKLCAYILAADLVGLPLSLDSRFKSWIRGLLTKSLSGKTLVSTHEHKQNNWGTACGATRLAIALYLENDAEIRRCAKIFHGWLGNRDVHAFKRDDFGGLDWQHDPSKPVGVNPKGATKDGRSIDGVLPEEMRRSGGFRWPPPKENYCYTALQGVIPQAIMLSRAGYDAWEWEDRAILRAFQWLYDVADYPAESAGGDDVHMLPVIDRVYGTKLWNDKPTDSGKIVSWTCWSHG